MNFTHSIMFHHFHNSKHLPAQAQGSLSSSDFKEMLDWLNERYNLIGANEYLLKMKNNSLHSLDVCLSFDDGLLSQYEIALPILNSQNLDAFFFIDSSVFLKTQSNLEIFRHFRMNNFSSLDEFYEYFFDIVRETYRNEFNEHELIFKKCSYLSDYPFYSENDKWFRYLRDQVLGTIRYEKVVFDLMSARSFDPSKLDISLLMSEDNIKEIHIQGHVVGLHSYSHPTKISALSYKEQLKEYELNLKHLEGLLGKGKVVSMSHPCGDYNDDTLKILTEMNIQIGFRSNVNPSYITSSLEIPREDHTNIFNAMKR